MFFLVMWVYAREEEEATLLVWFFFWRNNFKSMAIEFGSFLRNLELLNVSNIHVHILSDDWNYLMFLTFMYIYYHFIWSLVWEANYVLSTFFFLTLNFSCDEDSNRHIWTLFYFLLLLFHLISLMRTNLFIIFWLSFLLY